MKLGTQIEFRDGRLATVVFNSLIGVGVKWGLHDPDPEDFKETTGGTMREEVPEDWPWEPDALLRAPWDSCESFGFTKEQCIDLDYEVIRANFEKRRVK